MAGCPGAARWGRVIARAIACRDGASTARRSSWGIPACQACWLGRKAEIGGRSAVCAAAQRNRDIEHVETLLQINQPLAPGGVTGGPGK